MLDLMFQVGLHFHGKRELECRKTDLPSSGPQTLGIISTMAAQEASSKHSCRASKQFKIATAVFVFGPESKKSLFIIENQKTHHTKGYKSLGISTASNSVGRRSAIIRDNIPLTRVSETLVK